MIRECTESDFTTMLETINDAAQAYKGVIPDDCWNEPYMSSEELRYEIEDGVVFWGLDVHDECQACRLNHMPVASLVTPSLFTPLQLLVHLLPVEDTEYHLSRQFHTLWARAPPLF